MQCKHDSRFSSDTRVLLTQQGKLTAQENPSIPGSSSTPLAEYRYRYRRCARYLFTGELTSLQFSHHQRHVFPIRQPGLLTQPQTVVDGEGIDGHREGLGVDLGELLAARVILEELFKHVLHHLLGPRAVDLEDLLCVRVVGVQAAELALGVPEQEQEVGTIERINVFHDAHARVPIDHPGEDDMLDGVHDNCPIGLGRRLPVHAHPTVATG